MPHELDPKTLEKLAFHLYPSVVTAAEGSFDFESLLARIRAIRKGLLPETEFFAILSWLGKCAAIHRIDQTPMPIPSAQNLRAPDFIVFTNHHERIVPVLVECKATSNKKLVWSEKYFNSLKDFAAVLNIPLVVAWKWNDMWLVVDSCHLQKKVTAFHLDYETALKENLMSLLFGNLWISVNDKVSFRIEVRIIDKELDPSEELIAEGSYTSKVEKVGFYINDTLIDNVGSECTEILLSTFVENVVTKVGGNRIRITYHSVEGSTMVQLYDLLLVHAYVHSGEDSDVVQYETLLKGPFDFSGETFRNALAEARTSQFIDLVLQQTPTTIPEFLK